MEVGHEVERSLELSRRGGDARIDKLLVGELILIACGIRNLLLDSVDVVGILLLCCLGTGLFSVDVALKGHVSRLAVALLDVDVTLKRLVCLLTGQLLIVDVTLQRLLCEGCTIGLCGQF